VTYLFTFFHSQSFSQVANVVDALKLLDARGQHHHEQRHQQIRVTPEREVRFTAKFLKLNFLTTSKQSLHLDHKNPKDIKHGRRNFFKI